MNTSTIVVSEKQDEAEIETETIVIAGQGIVTHVAGPVRLDGAPPERLDWRVARREPAGQDAAHTWTVGVADWTAWNEGGRTAELRTTVADWPGEYHRIRDTVDVLCSDTGRRVRLVITHVARVCLDGAAWDLISTRRAYAHE